MSSLQYRNQEVWLCFCFSFSCGFHILTIIITMNNLLICDLLGSSPLCYFVICRKFSMGCRRKIMPPPPPPQEKSTKQLSFMTCLYFEQYVSILRERYHVSAVWSHEEVSLSFTFTPRKEVSWCLTQLTMSSDGE